MEINALVVLAGMWLQVALAPSSLVRFAEPVMQAQPAAQVERVLLPLDAQRRSPDPNWLQVDWPRERWQVQVPPGCEGGGCGLLVWIDPTDDPQINDRVLPVLQRHRVVWVAALNAGNRSSVERRRVPLAVQAAVAGCAHWRCDPQRIYVGGFSGGARAAGVAAMAWPDLFTGALMVGGGQAPGAGGAPLPSRERLQLAQRRSRFAFVLGDGDSANAESTRDSSRRLQHACMHAQTTFSLRRSGHRPLRPAELGRALAWLDQARPDRVSADACMRELLQALAADLQQLQSAAAATDRGQVTGLVRKWGNLLVDGAVR